MTAIDSTTTEPATFQELKVATDARITELEAQVASLEERRRVQQRSTIYREKQVRDAIIAHATSWGITHSDLNELLEELDLDPVVTSKTYNLTLSVQVTVEGTDIDWDGLDFDVSTYGVDVSASEGDVTVDGVDLDGFEED